MLINHHSDFKIMSWVPSQNQGVYSCPLEVYGIRSCSIISCEGIKQKSHKNNLNTGYETHLTFFGKLLYLENSVGYFEPLTYIVHYSWMTRRGKNISVSKIWVYIHCIVFY